MWLGVDYYPEQWDIEMIDNDLDNIIELGSNVIRIGEFAWHLMEKEEGKYDFSFFDMIIEKAKKKGLKIIFGTPTATLPAWLVKKYPNILSEFENGNKREFGGRHTACYNNIHYIEYSKKIVKKLVEHYKDEENIIAWQIDNELGHEGSDLCFCENCRKNFQLFLKEKFNNSIENLNYTYGTTFWSQEYNNFDEIPIPKPTITTHNPSLRMDWERFRSVTIENYLNIQVEIIKNIIPTATIIHDFPGGGLDKHVDYSALSKNLDIVAYNNYPVWGGQKKPIPPYEIAFGLDYIRGLKNKNFWITEGIMGAQGHDITGYLPRPNQAKMWSMQGVARGANSFIYFRYRGGIKGAEQFCYGIIDADNEKRRKFYEVKDFFSIVNENKDIFNDEIRSDIAILYDYDSLSSFRIQRQSVLLDPHIEMKKIYKQFHDRNIMVDIVNYDIEFSKYKVIIIPFMIIYKEDLYKKFEKFVRDGGKVLLTYRSFIKNYDNNLVLGERIPLYIHNLMGGYIVESESLQEYDELSLKGEYRFNNIIGSGGIFREMIIPTTSKTLFKYDDYFYNEYSAVIKNKIDKGILYYMGCSLEEKLLSKLIDTILEDCDIEYIYTPKNVELIERNGYKIYINHNSNEVDLGEFTLKPFEYKIMK